MAYIYMLRCEGDTLYTGITKDLHKRIHEHYYRLPGCAKYTRSHQVQSIAMVWETDDYREAARLEYYIKKMKRPQKEQLIAAPDAVALLVDERLTAEYRPHPEVTLEEMV